LTDIIDVDGNVENFCHGKMIIILFKFGILLSNLVLKFPNHIKFFITLIF